MPLTPEQIQAIGRRAAGRVIDTLFTGHSCKGSDQFEKQAILNVLSALRENGIPCFLAKDLTTLELEKQILGEG